MGFYINPRDSEKETWLEEHAQPFGPDEIKATRETPDYATKPANTHWVCLVDNGGFTAAGIAFNRAEFDRFSSVDDRDHLWLAIRDSDLTEVCPSVGKALD